MKFPNGTVNLLRGGGVGELVSFEYLHFYNPFMNSLIIHSISHFTHMPDFFYTRQGIQTLTLVPGGDTPPKVIPHLVNPPIAITNWP